MSVISNIECPSCGFKEAVSDDHELSLENIGLLVCERCGTRAIYGKPQPRVVVEPFVDDSGVKWARVRFQDAQTRADLQVHDIDPKLAAAIAQNLLSVVLA